MLRVDDDRCVAQRAENANTFATFLGGLLGGLLATLAGGSRFDEIANPEGLESSLRHLLLRLLLRLLCHDGRLPFNSPGCRATGEAYHGNRKCAGISMNY